MMVNNVQEKHCDYICIICVQYTVTELNWTGFCTLKSSSQFTTKKSHMQTRNCRRMTFISPPWSIQFESFDVYAIVFSKFEPREICEVVQLYPHVYTNKWDISDLPIQISTRLIFRYWYRGRNSWFLFVLKSSCQTKYMQSLISTLNGNFLSSTCKVNNTRRWKC